MATGVLGILGGLGLFLLGMAVMTEGLRDLAGETLRRALAAFTRNTVSGAATGAIGTALIQSSSATTVMAVGFVGAGLLTFPEALGIIFGANIGTTITGWLVALLGFKFSLTDIVLPFILVGALMRLFGGRRLAAAGYAVAGFGLVFAGIGMLQTGMEGFKDVVTPESFPPNTWGGRFLLVLIGAMITLIMQSSSAGVATAITAVHVGNISLPQAAAMVIGMDIATTVTAVIASIGGSVNARRTAIAHVMYNVIIGLCAFVLLPVYTRLWESLAPGSFLAAPEIALVAFHTLFNAAGLVLILPFTRQFSALIMRMLPDREITLTRRLDQSLLSQPGAAITAVRGTLVELTNALFDFLADQLLGGPDAHLPTAKLDELQQAIIDTRRYLSQIDTAAEDKRSYAYHMAALHTLDHLSRLTVRCRKEDRWKMVRSDDELAKFAHQLAHALLQRCRAASAGDSLAGDVPEPFEAQLEAKLAGIWKTIDNQVEGFRSEVMESSVAGQIPAGEALAKLDAIRWLRRVCYHAWRIVYHLVERHAWFVVPEELTEFDEEPDE